MSRGRLLLCLLPFLLLLMAFRDVPLVNPDSIAVPAGVEDKAILQAVRQALNTRGWIVTDEAASEVKSTLHLREHTARIAINWSAGRLHITYVGSENLKYHLEDGKPYIHKNYLGWIENLAHDISGALNLLATSK
jgi:hypothetical protein